MFTKRNWIGVILVGFIVAVSPFSLWAKTSGTTTSTSTPTGVIIPKGQALCRWLITYPASLNKSLKDQLDQLKKTYVQDSKKLEAERQEVDSKDKAYREGRDEIRKDYFDKLLAYAATDSQKQAISDFTSAIKAAMEERRAAHDQAVNEYRQVVDEARGKRLLLIIQAIDNYGQALNSISDKYSAWCKAGPLDSQERAGLIKELEAARTKLRTELTDAANFQNQINDAYQARNDKFETQAEDFNALVKVARDKLKIALQADVNLGKLLED